MTAQLERRLGRLVCVVIAGGGGIRYGADKLAAPLGDGTLLDATLGGLPEDALLIGVGPERRTRRAIPWVREEPPGSGPGRSLVAGARAALSSAPDAAVIVVAGDAPGAGLAVPALVAAAREHSAAVAVDALGHPQPLLLALAPESVRRLVDAGAEAGESARAVVERLAALPVRVPPEALWDVDTAEDLAGWQLRDTTPARRAAEAIAAHRPRLVALDGPSGAGKSSLTRAVAARIGGAVLDGDDFYSGPPAGSTDEAVGWEGVIDWRRLRAEALEPLLAGRAARYRRYDWHADDGSLEPRPVRIKPGAPLLLDGVYSARPELADLVELAVFVDVPEQLARARTAARDGSRDPREDAWRAAERDYFARVRTPSSFDLRVPGN